jgi:urease accessory protein
MKMFAPKAAARTADPVWHTGHAPRSLHAASPTPCERRGEARLVLSAESGATRIQDLYQKQPLRFLFPDRTANDPFEAALACVSGGVVAGDELNVSTHLHKGAEAQVVGQAAEKVYRSTGALSRVTAHLFVDSGSWLEWLPQETIVFDQARLRKTTIAQVAKGGRLLTGGILVFGRTAHNERLREGLVHDAWELRGDDGRLLWKEALHLEGDLAALLSHRATFNGANAYGNLLYFDHAPANLIDLARGIAERSAGPDLCVGATTIRNLLRVQFIGDATAIRNAFAEIWMAIRHANGLRPTMPRLWSI